MSDKVKTWLGAVIFIVLFLLLCVLIIGIPVYNYMEDAENTRLSEIQEYADLNGYSRANLKFKVIDVGERTVHSGKYSYLVGTIIVARGNAYYSLDVNYDTAEYLRQSNATEAMIDCYYNNELDDYIFPHTTVINSWRVDSEESE